MCTARKGIAETHDACTRMHHDKIVNVLLSSRDNSQTIPDSLAGMNRSMSTTGRQEDATITHKIVVNRILGPYIVK